MGRGVAPGFVGLGDAALAMDVGRWREKSPSKLLRAQLLTFCDDNSHVLSNCSTLFDGGRPIWKERVRVVAVIFF
jgi:hypothetical protein